MSNATELKKYTISDNFRCPAAQVVLANAVIKHNVQREAKELSLTQGFNGTVLSHGCSSSEDAGRRMVEEIRHLLDANTPFSDIVILVRTYGQTAIFEPELLAHKIPYVVVGNLPFYRRREIVLLIHYLAIGSLEAKLIRKVPLSEAEVKRLRASWDSINNSPSRFVSKEAAEYIRGTVVTGGIPFTKALIAASETPQYGRIGDQLVSLSSIIEFIADSIANPAEYVLHELDRKLQYRQKLVSDCAVEKFGRSRAESVSAFLKYSKGKGKVESFLRYLDELSFSSIDEGEEDTNVSGKLRITPIYRAKGSEWRHMFIPDCNDGTIPLANRDNEEEERRLLYVAITRAKANLHLFWTKPDPTEFLRIVDYESLLQEVETFHKVTKNHDDYRSKADLIHQLAQKLSFRRFVERWWKGEKRTGEYILKGMGTGVDQSAPKTGDAAAFSLNRTDSVAST